MACRPRRPPRGAGALPPMHASTAQAIPAPHSAGRSLRGSPASPAAAGPSLLLDAPSVDGWQPVPGAQPVTDGPTGIRPRIINGDIDRNWKLFPYVAFITWRFNTTTRFLCSGSLTGPSHILTAAHVSPRSSCARAA